VLLGLSRAGIWGFRRAAGGAPLDAGRVSLFCRAVLAFGSAAFLSLMALWFFHRIYQGWDQSGVPWPLLMLCTLVVIVTNLVVSVLFRGHRRQALFASLLSALVLLGAGDLLGAKPADNLPAKIMEKFGFGGNMVTLIVTERGGRILRQNGVPVVFERQARQPGNEVGAPEAVVSSKASDSGEAVKSDQRHEGFLARADNLTLLSTLGSQVLLRRHRDQPCDKGWTIVLPKEEVVSWSILSDVKTAPVEDGCKPPV
jgi:hypothetical protein